jgi:hypothetical protein
MYSFGWPTSAFGMDRTSRIADERYRLMLAQMKDIYAKEHGKTHGWQRWAAEVLGISAGHVRLLMNGDRKAGATVIDRAIQRYVHSPSYFYRTNLKNPDHREFLKPAVVEELMLEDFNRPREHDAAALSEFLGAGSHAPVTGDEIAQLLDWAAITHRKGHLRANDFAEALDLLRIGRRPKKDSPG